MLPYEKQLVYKQDQVLQSLRRIGKLELPEILPIIGSERTTGYRNKLEYTFSNRRYLLREELADPQISALQNAAGFHARGIFDKVVDVDTCWLQDEPTNYIRKEIKKWALENGVSFYDIQRHEGFLRNVQIRICRTGEIMVNVVFGYADNKLQDNVLQHLLNCFPSITTILYTINPKWNDSLNDLKPITVHGKGYVVEKLENFSFKIGPKSFFQTNTTQAERLYQTVRSFAALKGTEIIYDLYCGTGSIGIFLSNLAKKLIGIELIPDAIADAKENALLNQINHAAFVTGDVTEICNDTFFDAHGQAGSGRF